MILKNKIIFGGTGFLVSSGVIALAVILATSDNESSQKAKVKTKLDVSTLSSDSFKVSGTQTLGVVNLKSDMTLPKQIELKYFVGANAPANDKSFNSNKPSNLKNGDIVYIKFFIKKASIKNYEFKNKDSNPIKFLVSGLPSTAISHSLLIKDSFVISGNQTQGKVSKKPNVTFPKQVEIKYFRGKQAPNNDKAYKLDMPTNLSNGDKVHIKFFVKKEYASTHKFADDFTNSITIPIIDLPKTEIDSSLLVKGSFVISGSQTKGTISKKTSVVFPNEIEAKYFKGANAPSEDSEYLSSATTNLINGNKVHIKFFIKSEYIATHKFADDFTNAITIPIIDLKIEVDSSLLVKGSFVISGSQTKGTISKKTSVTFPTQVEAKYFKGADAPNEDSAYQQSVPTNLNNRDIVYIKFFIKDAFKNTYKFVENGFTNPIKFVVSDLIVNNGKIALQDSNGNIWAKWKGAMLQVLVKKVDGNYASSWTTSNTSGLLNGSNITSGGSLGAILEDSSGNIWAMGSSKPLQVLVKRADGTYANSWTHNTNSKLLRGSRINNGYLGVIFEDSSGNLWAMGYNSPLQVLIKNVDGTYANSWISDSTKEGLLKNSNISYGFDGVIFEDSSGNLWAMGYRKRLQVLAKDADGNYASSWINDPSQEGLLKNSNITNGQGGVIFEDSNGNLWAMGYRKRLQVLAKDADGNYASSWINDPSQEGLLKNSNIANGYGGVIFEDSSGNIWSMGHYSSLQVLVKDADGNYASSWINDPSQEGLLKDSNITKGKYGVIFEDSQGNIWAMGKGTPLQVLKKEGDRFASSWTNDTTSRLLNGSNITNGETGVIFEDSSGNIWAMGKGTPLQVLKKEGDKFASSWTRL